VSDVLSQSEIDSLLQQLNSGEVDVEEMKKSSENQVKEYDFARPSKFSKEHLRTLEMVFEHYGRLLSTNLPIYLRKNISVEVMNAEAISYMEFANALSNPVILGIVDFSPLKGNVIIEMASKLGYAIVDRLLGGAGEPIEKLRDFSEIELLLIERIMNICVNLLREPWSNVIDVNPRLDRIETNSQFAQIISPSEMTAVITVNVKIGDVEGLMNICLPYITLEPIMDNLNTKFWYSNLQDKNDASYSATVERLINQSAIPVHVVLGNSIVSINDFSTLRRGDIIKLDTKVDDELQVYVGDIKKFEALPGTHGKQYAVRVTKVIREEKEENE
jgi:flagellar motor switch protein FliM